MKNRGAIIALLVILGAAAVVYVRVRTMPEDGSTTAQPGQRGHAAETQTQTDTGPANRVIAYYFHANIRCESCIKIERFTDQAIQSGFADALKDGTLEWRIVNTDEPENAHYLEDLDEFSKSVILVGMRNGETVEHKSLEDVWLLIENPAEFHRYVKNEIQAYLDAYAAEEAPA
ncbi:MAG: hypothetical protein GY851_23000 [bacterium]|nr:hypothetical protein [bacterium]